MDYRKQDRQVWERIFQEAPDSWRSAPPSALMFECSEFLRSRGATRVLDLGSGFGRWANFESREANCRVVGLDYSVGGGVLGSQLGAEIVRSSFVTGEVTSLPFADSSFDGLIAVLILDNVSQPDGQTAIRELGQVMQPGSPGFVVLNPWPMPSGAETDGNPTSSCTRHDYADAQVLDDLFAHWQVIGWGRTEDELRAYRVVV